MNTVDQPTCASCGAVNLGTRYCENCGQEAAASPVVSAVTSPAIATPLPPVAPAPAVATPLPAAAPTYSYAPHTNTLAVLSLVFGLLGGALLPIIFGHIAKSQIRRTGERGDGFATAGLIFGYLWLVAAFVLFIVAVASATRQY